MQCGCRAHHPIHLLCQLHLALFVVLHEQFARSLSGKVLLGLRNFRQAVLRHHGFLVLLQGFVADLVLADLVFYSLLAHHLRILKFEWTILLVGIMPLLIAIARQFIANAAADVHIAFSVIVFVFKLFGWRGSLRFIVGGGLALGKRFGCDPFRLVSLLAQDIDLVK